MEPIRDQIRSIKHELNRKEELLFERSILEKKLEGFRLKQSQFGAVPQKEELARIKNELRLLDHQIDLIEEKEADLLNLKQSLIQQLFWQEPDKKIAYEKAINEEEKHLNEITKLELGLAFVNRIDQHLIEIKTALNRVKRLNILSYLFGPNPNLIITQNWTALKELLGKPYPEVISSNIIHSFQKTKELLEKRWGFKRIEKELLPLQTEINKERALIERALTLLRGALRNIDNDWF